MRNCPEWILAEQAVYCLGGATVPFYDTLGPDTVRYILEHTGMSCVVCSRKELARLCEAKASGTCPRFRAVVLTDGVTSEASSMASGAGLTAVPFAKVEAIGSQIVSTGGHAHSPPDAGDIATFCYTSGTTGDPKGALITHDNIMSAVGGLDDIQVLPTDRHISYLPLPHIFERVVVAQMISNGASMAFYRGDPLLLVEDIVACRPTIIPMVPRVLNKIHDKIQAGMAAKGGLTERMFRTALAAKTRGLDEGRLAHPVWDRLLFNKIKRALGLDCVRCMVSGSAPLSPNVMVFFRCLLGVPVMEGYGQTEGSAAATIGHPDDVSSVGHVGGPHKCIEVVLVDVPEMGYLSTGERPLLFCYVCCRERQDLGGRSCSLETDTRMHTQKQTPRTTASPAGVEARSASGDRPCSRGTTRTRRRPERRSTTRDGSTRATSGFGRPRDSSRSSIGRRISSSWPREVSSMSGRHLAPPLRA